MSLQVANRKTINFPRGFTTPMIGILSLVVGISGVLLFFHIGHKLLGTMHEWLAMAFVVAILIHVYTNWSGFKRHFKNPLAWVIAAAILTTSTGFVLGSAGESPVKFLVHTITKVEVSRLAPLLDVPEDKLIRDLRDAGLPIVGGGDSLQLTAQRKEMESMQAVAILSAVVKN